MTTNHHYKRFFTEFCTKKMKANRTMKGQAVPNQRRRKEMKIESNIDSAAHIKPLNNKTTK
jgi:hypothetical protein